MRRWTPVAALLAVALGLAHFLGSVTPIPQVRFDDARLGPESGQSVAVYLQQAAQSLAAAPAAERRWALVSPVTEWSLDELWRRVGEQAGVDRIGQVLVRVSIPGVQTPAVTVTPGQSAAGVDTVNELAALSVSDFVMPSARGAAIARVCASRLRAGASAVVGAVVYGTGDALRRIAEVPGVRAVQVLSDRAGQFAVAPLLPSFTERAEPAADDAPVPPA